MKNNNERVENEEIDVMCSNQFYEIAKVAVFGWDWVQSFWQRIDLFNVWNKRGIKACWKILKSTFFRFFSLVYLELQLFPSIISQVTKFLTHFSTETKNLRSFQVSTSDILNYLICLTVYQSYDIFWRRLILSEKIIDM